MRPSRLAGIAARSAAIGRCAKGRHSNHPHHRPRGRRLGHSRLELGTGRPKPARIDPEAQKRAQRRFEIVPKSRHCRGKSFSGKRLPARSSPPRSRAILIRHSIDTLIVAGETTSGCVRASVTDGCSLRYRMIVAEECVFDRHESCHAVSLFDMDQKYADVLHLAEILDWLQKWKATQRELAKVTAQA